MMQERPPVVDARTKLSPGVPAAAQPDVSAALESNESSARYRWLVVALLFAAMTINYIDRQTLGILAPTLTKRLHWSERDYGVIVSWFSLIYAFGFLLSGKVIDRIGVRLGLGLSAAAWSLAAIGHALVRTVSGFSLARAALGASESGSFPGSAKAVAEWFPPRERALATGIFNAGTSTGAIITPLVIPFVTLRWGWQAAFMVTGGLGMLWVLFWIPLYRNRPAARAAALRATEEKPSWIALLRYRQTWVLMIAKGCTDPIWVFYLYWLPKFLDARFHVKLSGIAAPLIAFYLMADSGSVAGGWLSSQLIRHGWSVGKARKGALLCAALLIVPVAIAPSATTMWGALAIISLAAAAHQAWAANIFTLGSDLFPRSMVGTAVGMGSFVGAIAAWGFQRKLGAVLDANGHNYAPIFLLSALAYVVTWLLIHAVAPRLEPIHVAEGGASS